MDNLGQMLKKAGELQTKMAEIQEKMAAVEITGTSGAGMVRVTLSGRGEARKIAIDPAIADDTDVMEDLIVAAFNGRQDQGRGADGGKDGRTHRRLAVAAGTAPAVLGELPLN